jgi:hypothetical protein
MTPELRLIVACCRWPDNDERRSALRRALTAHLDWGEIERLVEFHRVSGLVCQALRPFRSVPLATMERLERRAQITKKNAIRDLGETLRIGRELTSANIEHRFLKGNALGVIGYGTPTLKQSWDIDFLVHPENVVSAAECLEILHYEPQVPTRRLDASEFARWSKVSKEAEFHSKRGTTVELHWKLSDNPHLLTNIDASVCFRSVKAFGTQDIVTLGDAQNLAYLAVHGFSHAWFRLKWIADFNAFMNSFDRDELLYLVDAAAKLGVGETLDTGLELAGRLFGRPVGLNPSRSYRYAMRSLSALSASDEARAERIAAGLRWRADASWKYKLTELKIRARGTLDRLEHPLPARLHFLYPWLRIPFWLRRRIRPMHKKR